MHIVLLALVFLLSWAAPSFAGCSKADICKMIKKMGHFDILNACPQAGPLLAECKKVSEKPLVDILNNIGEQEKFGGKANYGISGRQLQRQI